ncbi:hypothetical protein [Nostoc linckia]|uniref:hypothetical protein n=1 Tax=Nostoc linckia TaxID=92942 RepID=UPI000BFFBA48|nr:hypothetical protein [Nostoc linckia]
MRITGIVIALAFLAGSTNTSAQEKITGPNAIIYKTKKDYGNKVPVILSEDKTEIVSYPHPSDLSLEDGLPTPEKLKKGYWLDRRGINKNVAFLNISYADYAALKAPPSVSDMYAMIVDKDPLTAMCDCGKLAKYKQPVKELNKLIGKRKFKRNCKTVSLNRAKS